MNTEVTPRPGITQRLSEMIQIQTVSAELDHHISASLEAFITLIESQYPLLHEHLERERITEVGLLYRWAGTDPDLPPAVLMAHYDVVPVDEADPWSHPPFSGHIEDGWVYGRGALDDKGPLVIILDAVENLLEAGFTPRRDIYLSFGGDEETLGTGAKTIAETLYARDITPWIVLDEGGAVVDAPLPFVEGDFAMVGVAEKGIATIRLSTTSAGGHASAPRGLTAVGRIARALTRLTPGMFTPHAPRGVLDMLRTFATKAPARFRVPLRALTDRPGATARVLAAMGGEMAAVVRTTIAPTMISGGTAHNVLPTSASAIINLRIALGETVADTVRRVRMQVRDRHIIVELVTETEPSPESPSDNEQFALIANALTASHPDATAVPYIVMAATDARWFHRYAPAVYRFAPLKMRADQRASIHAVNERVEVSELERGERFHRSLIQGL